MDIPTAKGILLESLANPILELPDIEAFAEVAHKHGIPLIIDVRAEMLASRFVPMLASRAEHFRCWWLPPASDRPGQSRHVSLSLAVLTRNALAGCRHCHSLCHEMDLG